MGRAGFKCNRLSLALAASLVLACGKGEKTSLSQPGLQPPEPPLPAALTRAPFDQLTFVPAEAEAVIRVDLAALHGGNEDRASTLDFILRSQQPAAWEVLRGAGIRAGRELSTLVLVVGPASSDREPFVIAGTGEFDRARFEAGLASSGATVVETPGGRLYRWDAPADRAVGAALPPKNASLGEAAVGVGEGLILVGPAPLVKTCLAARAGHGRDVRRGPLGDELLAIDASAGTWGVAISPGDTYLDTIIPGLERAHFSATLRHASTGDVALRAQFADVPRAEAFQKSLSSTLAQLGLLADDSPVGAVLKRLRDTGIHVDGTVVTTTPSAGPAP